jgi:hypothetical protein
MLTLVNTLDINAETCILWLDTCPHVDKIYHLHQEQEMFTTSSSLESELDSNAEYYDTSERNYIHYQEEAPAEVSETAVVEEEAPVEVPEYLECERKITAPRRKKGLVVRKQRGVGKYRFMLPSTVAELIVYYDTITDKPNPSQRRTIALALGLEHMQVHNWFKDCRRRGLPKRHCVDV